MEVVMHEGYHGILTRHHHNRKQNGGRYIPLGGPDPDEDDSYDSRDSEQRQQRKERANTRHKLISAFVVIAGLTAYVIWEFSQL
ncbi:hypothetical protein ACFQ3J_15935 [Paenibacillus provencensis]|uniref:Uncharacterized protein n=1 Tax=Paenibacillus provencensis TaxID=441151 RepID=A0ABW3PT70_9BACL|nr:hypothetical protein [Paenibacillus sp. MER 78]MCM3128161.1 hypothetical protein [Paenibacillus sp. MER 78]